MRFTPFFAGLALVAGAATAQQTVQVEHPWVRATLPGQEISSGYLTITSSADTSLVGAASPAAGSVELHEMKMDGDVMRMREVPRLDLPAGKAVLLKPGGYHLMLMGLKAPLSAGEKVPVTLIFKDADGKESRQQVEMPVAAEPVKISK